MLKLASLAVAALAVGLSAGASLADEPDFASSNNEAVTTVFDLGIDVSGVANSAAAVRFYLGSLAPETRSVILNSCAHYLDAPVTAQASDTLVFCSLAVNG